MPRSCVTQGGTAHERRRHPVVVADDRVVQVHDADVALAQEPGVTADQGQPAAEVDGPLDERERHRENRPAAVQAAAQRSERERHRLVPDQRLGRLAEAGDERVVLIEEDDRLEAGPVEVLDQVEQTVVRSADRAVDIALAIQHADAIGRRCHRGRLGCRAGGSVHRLAPGRGHSMRRNADGATRRPRRPAPGSRRLTAGARAGAASGPKRRRRRARGRHGPLHACASYTASQPAAIRAMVTGSRKSGPGALAPGASASSGRFEQADGHRERVGGLGLDRAGDGAAVDDRAIVAHVGGDDRRPAAMPRSARATPRPAGRTRACSTPSSRSDRGRFRAPGR